MGWLSGWTCRKSVTLSRASGQVTNYQMKLKVGETSGAVGEDVDCEGHCGTDFADLRFTTADGQTLLDYWIESITGITPNQLAVVWIEFDSIGTEDTTFYMYYGKADATAVSDGANTFLLFDHFNDGSIGAIWTQNGSPTESGTILTLDAASEGIKSTSTFQYKRFRASINFPSHTNTSYRNWAGLKLNFDQSAESTTHVVPVGGATTNMYRQTYETAWESVNDGGGFTDAYVIFQIDRLATGVVFYYNDVLKGTHTTQIPTASLPVWFMAGIVANYYSPFYVDWIFVANLAEPEPVWGSWSGEESSLFSFILWIQEQMLLAGKYNITIDQGSSFNLPMVLYANSELTSYFDLTNWTPRAQIRRNRKSDDIVASFSCIITCLFGSLEISLLANDTKNISCGEFGRRYFYDIEIENVITGEVKRIMEGACSINPEVTRE